MTERVRLSLGRVRWRRLDEQGAVYLAGSGNTFLVSGLACDVLDLAAAQSGDCSLFDVVELCRSGRLQKDPGIAALTDEWSVAEAVIDDLVSNGVFERVVA